MKRPPDAAADTTTINADANIDEHKIPSSSRVPQLALSGCIVTSAVNLAATTVMTAGKIAVKGTGALINAAIPDKDKKKDKEKKFREQQTDDYLEEPREE